VAIYYLFFLIIAILCFFPFKISKDLKIISNLLIFFVFVLFIGLRDKIGCDWNTYLEYYKRAANSSFLGIILMPENGFMLINWISAKLSWGVYGVNVISAAIFMGGLLYFLNKFRLNLLALLIAYSYLIAVAATGYTRQSIAIGLLLIAYSLFIDKKYKLAILFTLAGVLFHRTAIAGFLVFFLAGRKKNKFTYLVLILISASLVFYYHKYLIHLYRSYVCARMKSYGAVGRALLNAGAAVILISLRQKWKKYYRDFDFWRIFAWISLGAVPFAFYFSTTVDRLLLYFYPLQIVVLSRLPHMIENKELKGFVYTGVITLYFFTFSIWMLFAVHRYCWVPYHSIFSLWP